MKNSSLPPPTRAWRVVRLLWSAGRRRSVGRSRRQSEIMGRRAAAGGTGSMAAMAILGVIFTVFLHAILGWFPLHVAEKFGSVDSEREGRIVLSPRQWRALEAVSARQLELLARKKELAALARPRLEDRTAVSRAERDFDDALIHFSASPEPKKGASREAAKAERDKWERQFLARGREGFIRVDDTMSGQLAKSRAAPMAMVPFAGLVLLGWLGMLICQGEGLELDVQRRRHPIWEWLLSHPVHAAPAFYAELLTPLMVNPIYFTAPVFLWVVFGHAFGGAPGLLAGLLAGLPLAVAASGMNKSIEMLALLRLGVRTRGALLGVISWLGYVAVLIPILVLQADSIAEPLVRASGWIAPWFPAWPVRALTLGWGVTPSLVEVVVSWWLVAALLAALAVWVIHRATSEGLQAPTGAIKPGGSSLLSAGGRLGADPLRRKELLWLVRDKGAIVQVVMIPLTVAAGQALNFRGLFQFASASWSVLCGLAVICGTYFLMVLGPRSLASEGPALWLTYTWPHGLEDLLKAKARLWNRVSNVLVGLMLLVTCAVFPAAWWKIALVYLGWLFFSSTLALKAVSLVTAPSSSGEPEPPKASQRWIATIGTLAFGSGVVTGSWQVAVIGIVFSSLVALAMWQGLRARLPYLLDPWSELPVPAPSLIHATVGLALLVELIGVAMAIASSFAGPSAVWLARAIGYGVGGALGCLFMQAFLSARNVTLRDVIQWPDLPHRFTLPAGLALGLAAGAGLAVCAAGYLAALRHIPAAREALEEMAKVSAPHGGQGLWIFLLAVVFAPIAEEYFFRGLLFRTLDRELGDWRALVLSAGCFAIVHPPLAWLPVGCMGLAASWLFRSTRHLGPCVACHVAYNGCLLLIERI